MEYLNNWLLRHELLLFCVINGHIWLSSLEMDVGKSHEIAFSMTVQRDF